MAKKRKKHNKLKVGRTYQLKPRHEPSLSSRHIHTATVWAFIAIICVSAYLLTYLVGHGISGLVVYEITEHTKQWDFSNAADYSYNSSLISLNNGAGMVSNSGTTHIESYSYKYYSIIKALYDPDDKTDKVNALDEEMFEAQENKLFDTIFDEQLDNGDTIKLYIKSGNANEIFLCRLGEECISPGYGNLAYDGKEGWYNITISGLEENTIGFNINKNGKVKFDYIHAIHNNENISLARALYEPNDKTTKASALDDERFEANKNKQLNVIFNEKLNNNDITSIYAKLGDEGLNEAYLCDYGIGCNSPGYGKLAIDGEGNNYYWFNITISGLSEPIDRFNIDPEMDIDYISAYRIINNSYDIENVTYPYSAVIDTQDFSVEGFGGWGLLETDELSNGQTINYYYSIDSGQSWSLISSLNLSAVNSSAIRLRAELISDGTNAPVVNSISLNYFTRAACEEEWALHYSDCAINDAKLKYYTDNNNCGSSDNIPDDNDTYAVCDYCIPEWSCLSYGGCQPNGKKQCKELVDKNNCYNITGLTEDNYSGDYSEFVLQCSYDNMPPTVSGFTAVPDNGNAGIIVNISVKAEDMSNIKSVEASISSSKNILIKKILLQQLNNSYSGTWNTSNITNGTYIIGVNASDVNNNTAYYKQMAAIALANSQRGSFTNSSVLLITNQTAIINATEDTGAMLEIVGSNNLSLSISIAQYSENLKNITPPKTPLDKYFDIIADDTSNSNIARVKITFYYNDSDVSNANTDENTLRIYYYNETAEDWQLLNSSVNETANYVWAELSHFSTYGIFGERKVSPVLQASNSGGSSDGGGFSGGGSVWTVPAKKTQQVKEQQEALESAKQPEIIEEKTKCSYSLSVDIPEKASFSDSSSIKGTIRNNGNCEIEEVRLSLNKDADELATIEHNLIEDIKSGEIREITLKAKKHADETPRLVGFVIKPVENIAKSYSGELVSKAIAGNNVVVRNYKPINIEIIVPSEKKVLNPFLALGLIMAIIIVAIVKKMSSKRRSNNPKTISSP